MIPIPIEEELPIEDPEDKTVWEKIKNIRNLRRAIGIFDIENYSFVSNMESY